MAKRARGSVRPGVRRPGSNPVRRPAGRPATPPATALTKDEETRAAELEAAIVAEEQATQAAERRARERSRPEPTFRPREAVPLKLRASEEYAYVRRDVLRIGRIGGALLLVMALLFILIDVAKVITF